MPIQLPESVAGGNPTAQPDIVEVKNAHATTAWTAKSAIVVDTATAPAGSAGLASTGASKVGLGICLDATAAGYSGRVAIHGPVDDALVNGAIAIGDALQPGANGRLVASVAYDDHLATALEANAGGDGAIAVYIVR